MDPLDRLTQALYSAVDDSVKQGDTDYASAQVLSIIQLRTSRGEFLDGSGGKKKRSYQSESHKKKRAKIGLPTDQVTLFMGSVGVLEAMRARSTFNQDEVSIEVGYIEGLSEDRAAEIAGYLDSEGAGINRVTYPFVGLTDQEEEDIVGALSARLGANFQSSFNF